MKHWVQLLALHRLSVVVLTCNPSTGEVGSKILLKTEVQDHSHPCRKFKASLGYEMITLLTEGSMRNGERIILPHHAPAHMPSTERSALALRTAQAEWSQREQEALPRAPTSPGVWLSFSSSEKLVCAISRICSVLTC